ncbi:uncharacterized protein LOC121863633 [Homarus americanus]|uniref:uncharacterized protein LOC121863633 n=1 Tax=Homarus americanus TaxID=6706 RepID=UPI001C48F502|nr:uncharacterized protein LOC121863633 [Homarus americanus]
MRFSQRPTPKFSGGTYSEYWEFKRVFQRHVGMAQIPDTLKLDTLLAAYAGPAKDALRGCLQILDPKAGYKEALDILEKRHGSKHTYVCQLIKKALRGPTVRLSDAKGLQQFSDELGNCVRNLKVLGELRQIDTASNRDMRPINAAKYTRHPYNGVKFIYLYKVLYVA